MNTPAEKLKRFLGKLPGAAYGAIGMFLVFSILRPKFLSVLNILLILRHSSVLITASIGMTLVIVVSQKDMSIGSVMSLSGVIAAWCITKNMPLVLAIGIALAAGLLIGFFNGMMIARYKFDYWITTFAMYGICAGLALVVANGETMPIKNDAFRNIGNGKFLGVYIMVYITAFMVIVISYILKRTKFGHDMYSVGGSEQSAALSGINVVKVRTATYMLSGFFASAAGLMLASMGSSASPIAGSSYSFDAIAAVIIGGAAMDGGRGNLVGTVFGAMLLRILASGLNLLGVSTTWQKAIIGFAVVVIIVANVLAEKSAKKNDLRRRYKDVRN